jgi:hypothetical protein
MARIIFLPFPVTAETQNIGTMFSCRVLLAAVMMSSAFEMTSAT